jgi:replication factor C large subunit
MGLGLEYDLYNLDSLDNVLGCDHQISKLREFCKDINKGVNRTPLLLYGPSGVGKSISARLLAKEANWNVVELNASDYRDKETIESRLLSAATSKSLFSKKNLILLDEVDEIAAGFDKGAGAAIANVIERSKNPIIFIANNMWDQSITFLRGKVDAVEFKRLPSDTIKKALGNLCNKHSINTTVSAMEIIANRSNGDARSAINDLSVVMDADDDTTESIGLRDRKIDVFAALDKIFLTNTLSGSMRAVSNTDLTNDMLIKWIDENIPKRYRNPDELFAAFNSLSNASMYATRAMRKQYYTYWRYMNVLMSGGVALAKKQYPNSGVGYSFPKVIKELSSTKLSRGKERAIALKLQRVFHSSVRKIVSNEMVTFARSISKSIKDNQYTKEEITNHLSATYMLDDNEIEYMLAMNC